MRTKICGITNVDDAAYADEVGAWALGLNRWRPSPRYCDAEVAAEIAARFKKECEIVGVYVNETLDRVVGEADALGLTMVQLHGDEGVSYCREVARRTGCRVIKAIRIRSTAEIQAAEAFRTDFHLMDAYSPAAPGGTGESFDWELTRARTWKVPLILAGGLKPENVGEAIAAARPWAVDVASGVESEPGRKDPERVLEFMRNADAAGEAEWERRREERERRKVVERR